MRLERLELIGFKSFAEKTVFSFHPGITSIVGPNGCGKSNVVDAFKWVLGEQSAKSLRGDSMEDVIFFGSATKKTKGMAEVTLILSGVNGDGNGESESSRRSPSGEVSVTRRLYRSGESEYLMNKVPCRLKDIKNMFLDTGLELKAYSILEQGRINHILNSKPQDRRFLIEEVAGVMKFKVRKAEAMQKLESSKSNLQRLHDIINEVKRQINSIDRHAKKAERYKKLFEEIQEIDIRIAKRDVERLKQEVSGLTATENSLKGREAELSARLHSAEAMIEEKKRGCVEKEKSLDQLRVKLYSSEKVVTEGEGKKALLASDCENLRGRIARLQERESELARERESSVQSLDRVREEDRLLAGSLQSLQASVDTKNRELADMNSGIAGLEERLESERRALFTRAEEISILKNEVKHLTATREHVSRKREKSSGEVDSVRNELSALAGVLLEAGDTYRGSGSELSVEIERKDGYLADLRLKRDGLAGAEEALYRDREGLAAMISKLDSLQEIEKNQSGTDGDVVAALCQVADIFETPLEYETALEAVLGEKLSASVVGSRDDIARAIQVIREQNAVRSGFISADSVKPGSTSSSRDHETVSAEGLIGRAIDLVSVKNGHDKIAAALLHDVLLVSDLKTAFSMRERSSGNPQSGLSHFVTLEGDVLEPSGIVFGGVQKGVLKVKRQLKELQKDVTAQKEVIQGAESAIGQLKTSIREIEENLAGIEGVISSREKSRHELQVRITGLQSEEERLKKKLEFLAIEIHDEEAQKENLSGTISEKEAECVRLESEKSDADNAIRRTQEDLVARKETLEKERLELTGIRLEITTVKEKLAALSREAERLESTIRDSDSKRGEIADERGDIEAEISRKQEDIRLKEDELKATVVLIDRLRGEVTEVNESLQTMNAELSVLEERQKVSFKELESLRKELSHVEVKNTESTMNLKHLIDDVRKTYSLEIETAEVAGDVSPEEEENLKGLKEKLQAIGPVSLGTLEEFEELKTRYEFLTKQQDDLLSSVKSLEDTIQKINRSTKQRLTDAFEALNGKFKEVFNLLFGEGRAELILTDEGDILESGIEIVAQPPGKRLKNLSLLSGGEQALTALSLLFAGFMVKPTPLCLLDEVDAPLDESNTERFISLLSRISEKIQFITITHNRRTMEAADYIYGVTMEEPGVSNVISMHLAEA